MVLCIGNVSDSPLDVEHGIPALVLLYFGGRSSSPRSNLQSIDLSHAAAAAEISSILSFLLPISIPFPFQCDAREFSQGRNAEDDPLADVVFAFLDRV